MRIALSIVAAGLIGLGMYLISMGVMDAGPPVTTGGQQIAATHQTAAGPIAVGVALLVGGVLFFVLLLRRR